VESLRHQDAGDQQHERGGDFEHEERLPRDRRLARCGEAPGRGEQAEQPSRGHAGCGREAKQQPQRTRRDRGKRDDPPVERNRVQRR
jgi:hypothetical protein